jgi:putative addiction module component (TIGR02574 family)
MSTLEIKRKLFDYIRNADTRKVKAIYTIIENEIQEDKNVWTDEFVDELNRRSSEFESGKVSGYTWEEVKTRARNKRKASKS